MNNFVAILALVSCAFAADVSKYPSANEKESLELLNDRVMARLREEAGSERGLYHVYLPDGRLQRVQYTAAPINSQQPQIPSNEYREKKQAGLTIGQSFGSGANAYYVQVPEDRLQAILAAQQPRVRQQYQQPAATGETSSQYSRPLEVNAQFVPLQVVTPEQLAQYRNQQ